MRRPLAALAALALTLAACGGGEEATTTTDPTATTTTTAGDAVTTTTAAEETTTTMAPAADGLPVRACDLVPDADVSAFLGVDVAGVPGGIAEFGDNPLADDCLWQSDETFESFSIQYFGDQGALDDLEFEDEDFGISWDVADYPGIGDGARTLVDPDTGQFNSIWVATGPYVVVCYPDPFAEQPVEVDGADWDGFLALCRTAVGNAAG